MAKVLAKAKNADKHCKSVEMIKAVVGSHINDFKSISNSLGYTPEEISEALKFVNKLKVTKA